jgi:hypothetical protein
LAIISTMARRSSSVRPQPGGDGGSRTMDAPGWSAGPTVIQRVPPSRAIRAHLRTRAIGSVIPEPDDQKAHCKRIGSSGGRPVTYDRTAYLGRNVIECAFNGFKHWRGLATRYDEHAIVYRGGLVLAAVLPWLTDSGDTSWEGWHQLGLSSAAGCEEGC